MVDEVIRFIQKSAMPSPHLATLETRYAKLRQQLSHIGYLSHGSIYRRPLGRPGTRFTWSTKVKAKTVSLALSEKQANWLEKAIAEHRRLNQILTEMRTLSRKIMRAHFPDTSHRKPLNKKVLRLI
jgi:hypothetical protein